MKLVIIILTTFFAMGSAVYAQTAPTAPKKEVQKTVYACPMHPKVISDKKGKCPKCGMDLVATKEPVHAAAKANPTTTVAKSKYVCTMDGSTADKPGKCPKCGMAMVERKNEKK